MTRDNRSTREIREQELATDVITTDESPRIAELEALVQSQREMTDKVSYICAARILEREIAEAVLLRELDEAEMVIRWLVAGIGVLLGIIVLLVVL